MAVAIRSDAPFAARLGLGQGRRDDGAFLVQHDRIGVLALFFQMLQLVARLVFQTLGVLLFRTGHLKLVEGVALQRLLSHRR